MPRFRCVECKRHFAQSDKFCPKCGYDIRKTKLSFKGKKYTNRYVDEEKEIMKEYDYNKYTGRYTKSVKQIKQIKPVESTTVVKSGNITITVNITVK